jgi:hypothetical protein
MRKRLILLSPLILLAFVLFVAIGGEVVKVLWNWLMPSLFGWPPLTFWQALALLALCRILFGGLGLHGGRSGVRRRIAEQWEHMSPEERDRMRQRMRERWGFGAPTGGTERP